MTECPKCKGYGIIGSAVPDILRGRGAIFSSNECDMCHGSGEVPMTNEEWFCSLPTKEKAKFLRQIYRDGRDDYVGEWYEQTEKDFVEWLKEKHDGNNMGRNS